MSLSSAESIAYIKGLDEFYKFGGLYHQWTLNSFNTKFETNWIIKDGKMVHEKDE